MKKDGVSIIASPTHYFPTQRSRNSSVQEMPIGDLGSNIPKAQR